MGSRCAYFEVVVVMLITGNLRVIASIAPSSVAIAPRPESSGWSDRNRGPTRTRSQRRSKVKDKADLIGRGTRTIPTAAKSPHKNARCSTRAEVDLSSCQLRSESEGCIRYGRNTTARHQRHISLQLNLGLSSIQDQISIQVQINLRVSKSSLHKLCCLQRISPVVLHRPSARALQQSIQVHSRRPQAILVYSGREQRDGHAGDYHSDRHNNQKLRQSEA